MIEKWFIPLVFANVSSKRFSPAVLDNQFNSFSSFRSSSGKFTQIHIIRHCT